jgi:hypothetical protein
VGWWRNRTHDRAFNGSYGYSRNSTGTVQNPRAARQRRHGRGYKAHDTKLGRDIAIKTLPYEFARDPDRLARFRREVRVLASLNHPNIATIHRLEESGGSYFLVMEFCPRSDTGGAVG